jgi:hypothetical protein
MSSFFYMESLVAWGFGLFGTCIWILKTTLTIRLLCLPVFSLKGWIFYHPSWWKALPTIPNGIWASIEQNTLWFMQHNQDSIYVDLYQGIKDEVKNDTNGNLSFNNLEKRIILFTTFIGKVVAHVWFPNLFSSLIMTPTSVMLVFNQEEKHLVIKICSQQRLI